MHEEAATWQRPKQHQTKAEPDAAEAEADAVERSLMIKVRGSAEGRKDRARLRRELGGGSKLAGAGTRGTREESPGEARSVPTTTTRITIQTCSSAWLAAIAVGHQEVGGSRNKGNDRGRRRERGRGGRAEKKPEPESES